MSRIRQIEDVIRTRRSEELKMQVRLEEAKLRILVGSIYAANGNKNANRAADHVQLIEWPEEQKPMPATENAFRMFPPGAEGLYTPEQIAAEAEKHRG